jgi:hypothetical protein
VTHHAKAPSATKHPIALGGLALFALVCLQLVVFASGSQAAVETTRSYVPGAFLGGQGSEPGQFNEPSQIATEPGTGNLLVTDSGNGRVQVLSTGAAGNPSFLTTLGAGTLITPVGIAIDQGTGAIYVSDSGAGKVFRFASDGAPTPTYTLDATFTGPTELGSFASTLAVDPTTHDLLVADTGSQEIRRFDIGDGHLIKAFNGSSSPGGQFTSLRSVAVAPAGAVFVVDEHYPGAAEVEPDGARVERFDAAGASLGQLQGVDQEGAVGVEPGTSNAFVAWHNFYESLFNGQPPRVSPFGGSDFPLFSVALPSSAEGGTVGITISGVVPHPVYVLLDIRAGILTGAPGIQPMRPAEVPGAEIGPTSGIDTTSAHVSGAVAPGVLSGTGTAHFEYSLNATNWTSTPDQSGISGPGETAVSADLGDLRPNTDYSVRIHIANDDFSGQSPVATFTTAPVAPGLQAGPVSDRTATSAVLNGKVNPFGQQTTYHFEYGETVGYGKTAPAGVEDVAGNGYVPRVAYHAVSGLQPSTTYHYRLVATNATGTSATADATFTTRPATEPIRAYEQVTPVDKRGLVVSPTGLYMAEAAGNGIVYQVRHAYDAPDTAGSVNAARYAAVRSVTGWELRQLDVPQAVSRIPAATVFNSTLAVSADFSHALVGSDLKLAPGGVDGVGNLYRRNLATGSLELVATGLSNGDANMQAATSTFYGGSVDFSRIVIMSENQLTPEAGPFDFQIYEWSVDESLRVISTLPDGSSPAGPSNGVNGGMWPARQSSSADGSRVYFTQEGRLYLREAGVSRLISPIGGSAATFFDTSPDGRFVAYAEALELSERALYRYDLETDTREFVGTLENDQAFRGMSDDGSSIFLGGTSGSLYAWHEGVTSVMGTIDGSASIIFHGMGVSPNGRYFTFVIDNLAAQQYDNSNPQQCGGRCREVYVYDVEDQQLTCVSCPADGRPSAGHAGLGANSAEFNHYGAPFVNDKGQSFFDTPTKLVAADTNGRRDVYEYRDGEVQLISPGTGDHAATFADASANGDSLFFLTSESLVGQDQDGRPDIYDARVGGGIASQSPGIVPGCGGGDCRAPSAAPVASVAAASESVAGRPRTLRHKAKHHKKKAKHRKKKAGHHKQRAKASTKSDRTIGK